MYMHKHNLVHSVSSEDNDDNDRYDSLQIDSLHLTVFDSLITRVGTSLSAVPLQ